MKLLKNKSFLLAMFIAVAAVAMMLVPEVAMSADINTTGTTSTAGEGLLADVFGVFQGSVGALVGLGISLLGLWMWLMQQNSWGIVLLIAGALLTVFPDIFASFTKSAQGAFSASTSK